jgi:capsular polysaccharide biosynthesis protein
MAVEDPPLVQYQTTSQPQPRLSVLQAVQRSIPLVLLPVVVLVGLALAIGLLRSPTYTSEARLNVGGLNLTTQTLAGYTTAVQQLAVAYSRAIDAQPVIRPVSRRLGLPPSEVAKRVSATPIQGSPVIRIRATSKDGAEARRLADAVAGSLVSYAISLNRDSAQSARLLREFKIASKQMHDAGTEAQLLKPTDPNYRRAKLREDIARLRAQTAGTLYQQSVSGQTMRNLVQRLAPAAPATSDRSSVLQQLLAGALIAGLLIGVGLAMLRANRLTLRRLGAR